MTLEIYNEADYNLAFIKVCQKWNLKRFNYYSIRYTIFSFGSIFVMKLAFEMDFQALHSIFKLVYICIRNEV